MSTEYVPVDERVQVVELPQDMHGIDVFVNSDETWSRVGCGHSKRATESAAEDLVAAFKDACEAMRERCAEHVADRACKTPCCADPSCCGFRALASAIRGLEL